MIDLKNAMALAIDSAAVASGNPAEEAAAVATSKSKLPGVPIYKARVDGSLLLFAPAPAEVARELFARTSCAPEVLHQDLVRACLLHPSMNDLAGLAQHRPLLMLKLAIQCMAICGFGEDQDFKRADR